MKQRGWRKGRQWKWDSFDGFSVSDIKSVSVQSWSISERDREMERQTERGTVRGGQRWAIVRGGGVRQTSRVGGVFAVGRYTAVCYSRWCRRSWASLYRTADTLMMRSDTPQMTHMTSCSVHLYTHTEITLIYYPKLIFDEQKSHILKNNNFPTKFFVFHIFSHFNT